MIPGLILHHDLIVTSPVYRGQKSADHNQVH